jgi:hypothetical protein
MPTTPEDMITPLELFDRLISVVAGIAEESGRTHHLPELNDLRRRLRGDPTAEATPAPKPLKAETQVGNTTPPREHNSGGATVLKQTHDQGQAPK